MKPRTFLRPDTNRHQRLIALSFAAVGLLTACGGGGGGGAGSSGPQLHSATFSQPSDVLGKEESLVIRFDASVDPASLRLSGGLAAEATGTWSSTDAENDTYTLTPVAGTWTSGADRDIVLSATGQAGGSVSDVRANYLVKLVFDTFQTAAVAIGQRDFAGGSANQGGLPAADTFSTLYGGVAVAPDGRLFVGDYNNIRLLAFDALPATNGASAALVFGQPDFATVTYPWTPLRSNVAGPQQVSIAAGKMAVVDYDSNRVTIYNSIPTQSDALPDVVIGQDDFTTNRAACSASGLSHAESVLITPDGKLLVADSKNNRVLLWNAIPTVNGQAPDVVLGQNSLTTCVENDDDQDGKAQDPTGRTFFNPTGVWSDGRRLAVIDSQNNRVLLWNQLPTSNFQASDLVLGQSASSGAAENDDDQDGTPGAPTARTLSTPYLGISSNGEQLAVADQGNHRVLVWNAWPTANFQPADVVIGQGSFGSAVPNDDDEDGAQDPQPSARTLNGPDGLLFYRDKLIVTDGFNARLLVFSSK